MRLPASSISVPVWWTPRGGVAGGGGGGAAAPLAVGGGGGTAGPLLSPCPVPPVVDARRVPVPGLRREEPVRWVPVPPE